MAPRFLAGRAFALEGDLGLLDGGLLLLELSLRLLAHALHLTELLPHRSKQSNLICQINPQMFSLLGLLIGLGLPRLGTLEGDVVLLKLSLCRGERRLPLCPCLNLSTSMGGTRSKVEGGDRHDLEPEGTREDTRHEIYTGSGSRSSYPTSCLG
jgi:hypothetical protein